jgi:hypothetical protein
MLGIGRFLRSRRRHGASLNSDLPHSRCSCTESAGDPDFKIPKSLIHSQLVYRCITAFNSGAKHQQVSHTEPRKTAPPITAGSNTTCLKGGVALKYFGSAAYKVSVPAGGSLVTLTSGLALRNPSKALKLVSAPVASNSQPLQPRARRSTRILDLSTQTLHVLSDRSAKVHIAREREPRLRLKAIPGDSGIRCWARTKVY